VSFPEIRWQSGLSPVRQPIRRSGIAEWFFDPHPAWNLSMILFSDLAQAVANLRAQKTRTLLTALGIVFGVGSVIGMLAIGSGAREESLRFIEQLGVRNVLVDSRPATSQEQFQQRRRSSPGLSDRDVRILKANIEALETLSARKALHPARVLPKPARDIPELYGVEPSYSIIHSLHLAEGRFFDAADDAASATVCVLGEGAKVNLLGYAPAVGKFVKVNDSWMEVVGPGRRHEGRARWRRPPKSASACRWLPGPSRRPRGPNGGLKVPVEISSVTRDCKFLALITNALAM
jgi:hypothetical protein